MRLRSILFVSLLLAFGLLISCVRPGEVRVENLESFNIGSVSAGAVGVEAELRVANLSDSKITLREAHLHIRQRGIPLMEVLLRESVVVPRRSTGTYALPLSVRFEGLGGMLAMGSLFAKGMKDCTVDIDATLKNGWVRKRVHLENIPVDSLLKKAGIDPVEFFRLY